MAKSTLPPTSHVYCLYLGSAAKYIYIGYGTDMRCGVVKLCYKGKRETVDYGTRWQQSGLSNCVCIAAEKARPGVVLMRLCQLARDRDIVAKTWSLQPKIESLIPPGDLFFFYLYIASLQRGDLRLSGPPSGRNARGGTRIRDRVCFVLSDRKF
ncbi:hypothetical protein PoB_001791200 [Plakobranchus ocellatus]|uniref:Uncharacterized protein n=1 Tax=Plakobranchus ocellatus TaxID=259542 RepID=A0AAV3ZAA5_9GAST|nr:hypothetical protein PoB_001791200 [Plakobranchus ocellatus]